ncbi:MAG: hypothetical protein WCO07_02755 [bacterium]
MEKEAVPRIKKILKRISFWFLVSLIFLLVFMFLLGIGFFDAKNISYNRENWINNINSEKEKLPPIPIIPPLDKADYDLRLKKLANIKENTAPPLNENDIKNSINNPPDSKVKPQEQVVIEPSLWPVNAVYPNAGAILPFKRVVAYYGNLYSTKMGVLGEYPENEMLERLMIEVKKWTDADPETPVIPALHYIAVVAQGSAGKDGKYRARMPDSEIDKVIKIAEKVNGIVFLDLQVGFSDLQTEIPLLEKYFKMPQVHLGIDPEFSMKTGVRPGKIVGTFDAADINYAADYLAKIVRENNLTPKILIIHRYTQKMVTNYDKIKPLPEVQILMHMDGWGGADKKINTYKQFIYKEPVQFTGFKLFYKNDILEPKTILMSPEQLLKLTPRPIYIQYQ